MNKMGIVHIIIGLITLGGFYVIEAKHDSIQNNKKSFYIGADYLFWQASEDQLQYALKIPGGFPKDGLIFASQIFTEEQTFKWNSGVRVKTMYFFCEDWDFRIIYTHFKKSSFTCTEESPNGILATTLFGLLDFGGVIGARANSNWFLNFNTVNAELEYDDWYPVYFMNVRPYIGVTWAKINQSQHINYFKLGSSELEVQVTRNNDFWSFGPRAGIDTKWYIWSDRLAIIGNMATALLHGTFNIDANYFLVNTTPPLSPTFFDSKKRLRPMMQMLLGIHWEQPLDKAIVEIGGGYEVQYWWNQWQVFPSGFGVVSSISGNGDLMVHGLVLHLGVQF